MASGLRNNNRVTRTSAKEFLPIAKSDDDDDETVINASAKEGGGEEPNYEVESVIGKKYDHEGNVSYLLKWKGWDGEPTWEPEENCLCEKLLSEYEKVIAKKQDKDNAKRAEKPLAARIQKIRRSISKPASAGRSSATRRAIRSTRF